MSGQDQKGRQRYMGGTSELQERCRRLTAASEEFCDRFEKGEVRSSYAYRLFCSILERDVKV